ncbi:MAG: hypothetical protein LBC70_03045 [Chitinispirillales bacterium]|jgi:hypothetical protein|nr:hypothetical protein [Chitinispirillales bacterium]
MNKKITSEDHLYAQLARRGDPAAFYALFNRHIRGLYILLRSRDKDHSAACGDAAAVITLLYRKFISHNPRNAQKWFAGKCGLKRFDAAAGSGVAETDIASYSRQINAALNRAYSERLDRGSDGKGNIKGERVFPLRLIGGAVAVASVGFLFFSGTTLSISFERFDSKEYRLSFPDVTKKLWNMSGFVRSADAGQRHASESPPAYTEPTESHE